MRISFLLISSCLFAANVFAQTALVKPMAQDAHPSFAVATIKPHNPTSNRTGFEAEGDRFAIQNETVASMVQFAYSVDKHQIADVPDWVSDDSWDIEGITDIPGEPSLPQLQEMLQKLLANRFGLRFHREKRSLSVYAIRIAKGGAKLKPAAAPNARFDEEGAVYDRGSVRSQTYTSASLADFILTMQLFLDRPIVDQTALTGRFDFKLRYLRDESKPTADPNAPPSLFTAIQEQLGLKLVPTKTAVEVLVFDHVEQPSAN